MLDVKSLRDSLLVVYCGWKAECLLWELQDVKDS